MEELLTFVNVGIAARASPRKPSTAIRCKFGINPRVFAASRYSSELPSKQITTTGRTGGAYVRPFAAKGNRVTLISGQGNTAPRANHQVTVVGTFRNQFVGGVAGSACNSFCASK
jgi:hypothetical protein